MADSRHDDAKHKTGGSLRSEDLGAENAWDRLFVAIMPPTDRCLQI